MTRTQRSFETLYHAHVSDVYRYALAVTGQTSDAEDVTQTTFLNAYRAYTRGERPRKPQNWLLTIAHNVCRQRARFAYYRVREVELDEGSAEALAPSEDVPTAADIRRALSHLPFQQRAVLIMRELEGRTHAEIAEVMELTTQATEMLAFRARRALREHLAGSLTCTQASSALDRQLDGTLDAESAGLLRAHLRECDDCEHLARRMRAQQKAWKSLTVVPLPTSLHSFSGAGLASGATAGGAGIGAGVVAKVAAVTIAAATVGGGAYLVKRDVPTLPHHSTRTPTAHARRQTTKHSSVSAVWRSTPATGTHATATSAAHAPTKHKTPQVIHDNIGVFSITVPAVPTGGGTLSVPPVDQPTETAGAPVQPGDVSPQADEPVSQASGSDETPPPTDQNPDQGVRAHGAPATTADPHGGGPQGKSQATPPPYGSQP